MVNRTSADKRIVTEAIELMSFYNSDLQAVVNHLDKSIRKALANNDRTLANFHASILSFILQVAEATN